MPDYAPPTTGPGTGLSFLPDNYAAPFDTASQYGAAMASTYGQGAGAPVAGTDMGAIVAALLQSMGPAIAAAMKKKQAGAGLGGQMFSAAQRAGRPTMPMEPPGTQDALLLQLMTQMMRHG